MESEIIRIAAAIAGGKNNIVFTGAGISTESGIPDYRSQGGLWDKFRPVYFHEFMSSREARVEYWRRKSESYVRQVAAEPNPAHLAIAELNDMGRVRAVITQNIDGLHQKSGIPEEKIIELHGSDRRVRCMGCGALFPVDPIHERVRSGDAAPECDCGGYLKPDTISFGQDMPREAVARATELSRAARFFMVIGSTLIVQPAALMPAYAKEGGAFLAMVNLSETPYDPVCDVLIRGKAGEVLPGIVDGVKSLSHG